MAQYLKLGPVEAGDIDSEAASAGQVLTADGSGGAGWQDAAGGGGAFDPQDLSIGMITDPATTEKLTTAFVAKFGRAPLSGDFCISLTSSYSPVAMVYDGNYWRGDATCDYWPMYGAE